MKEAPKLGQNRGKPLIRTFCLSSKNITVALLSNMLTVWRHRVISPYVKGRVLDIGCGNALILQHNHAAIDRYVGVEFGPERIAQLSERFPSGVFISRDLDREPLALDEKFDVILLIAVIEHVWNQKFLFEQIVVLLNSGGKIVITTPTPFGNDIIHPIGAAVGLFAEAAVEDHIVIYNKQRFKNLAREFGLRLELFKRFQFFSNQLAVLSRS
jgi:SAM-dependent methyltransferase